MVSFAYNVAVYVPLSIILFDPRLIFPSVTDMNEYASMMEYSKGPHNDVIAVAVDLESVAKPKV